VLCESRKTAAGLPFFFLGGKGGREVIFNAIRAGWVLLFLSLPIEALEFQGSWQQGAILRGQVEPGTRVEFLGRQLRLTEDGRFVIGLGRDFPAEAVITTRSPKGEVQTHRFAVAQRDYRIQRVDGVPQSTVTPDPEQVERARREALLVSEARKKDLPLDYFTAEFQWPLLGWLSSSYGSQRIFNNVPGTPHYGVDIAAPTGTSIAAPAAGVVTLVHPDMFFSGGTLIIDHGQGLSSTYIHLSKILVKEGDEVSQGQKIALVGSTGRATGPHLCWRMNWFDQRVDPSLLVPPMPSVENPATP
jgi:murein DD-endopeptidase MepM/ murein hydrolase activator NlpD